MAAAGLRPLCLLCLLGSALCLPAEPEKRGLRGLFARKQGEVRKQSKQAEGRKQAEVAEGPGKGPKRAAEAQRGLPAGVERPSKDMVNKVRPVLRQMTDDAFKRATAQLHAPNIPAVFRWELVGKITQWATKSYQKPKKVANLDLVNSLIDLSSEVLSSEGASSLSFDKLAERFLANASRVEQMALHYAQQIHAPPAAMKLISTAAQAMKEHKAADAQSTFKLLVDAANETTGPALADLLVYGQAVAKNEVKADAAKILDMEAKLATRLGAPPAMAEHLRGTAALVRRGEKPDEAAEGARLSRALGKAADELHMPPAFAELFGYLADAVFGNATHALDKAEVRGEVLLHVTGLASKICSQLGGPPAISELIELSAGPLINTTVPDSAKLLELLAKLTEELKLPKAVQESLTYLRSTIGHKAERKPEREVELLAKLTDELGAPPAISKFQESLGKEIQKGSTPDKQKILKMVTQLMHKLQMPALAGVTGTILGPLVTKGTPPNALALAAVAPNLMKIMPEVESANTIFSGMRSKLLSPLMPVYETAVEKLTGGMPDSLAKSVFKRVLSVARPPVPPPSEEEV